MNTPSQSLDIQRLQSSLGGRVPGFEAVIGIDQFEGGQSNPTYRITTAAGDYVLRKKPTGQLLPSAHRIDREYRIMQALAGEIPVPQMVYFSEDETILGEAFYLMQFVEGRLMADPGLPEASAAERPALYAEMVQVLARLHSLDYRALGLADFGQSTHYIARQLARWTRQYAASRIEDNADMDRLMPWLEANLPESEESGIVHGDFRSYNILFHPDRSQILAVLDWELSTIGHPLADLAYFCLPYYLPPEDPRGFRGEDPVKFGLPRLEQVKADYCRASGRADLQNWRYFVVFSLFRSAAIRAGVFKRAHDGTAVSTLAHERGSAYRAAAAAAWRIAQST